MPNAHTHILNFIHWTIELILNSICITRTYTYSFVSLILF